MNKYLAIALLISICVCILFCVKHTKNENTNTANVNDIRISTFEIKDRVSITKNNEIYIGANKKELDNNFYDIKISTQSGKIKLTLNKLWRYKCNNEYIEDEYLIEIVDKVTEILDIHASKQDISYELYKYIKQNFLKVKNNEKVTMLELEKIKI